MTSTYVFKSSGWVLCHNAFAKFVPDSASTDLKQISNWSQNVLLNVSILYIIKEAPLILCVW